jgi:hypothetical protein
MRPDLKHVVVAVSILTLSSFALNIGLAIHELGTYTLPLDDAWIHQAFARNLARGQWFTYSGGQASSGSTSPAWTALLAIGHLLHVAPVTWALLLAGLFHILAAVMTYRLSLALFGSPWLALWCALLVALEWHLVWIALSGMETSMFVALSLLYLLLMQVHWRKGWLMGLVGGLLFLTRPEAIVLVAFTGIKLAVGDRRIPGSGAAAGALKRIAPMALTFLLVTAPTLTFNTLVSGRPLPGTFYAKYVQWVAPWTIGKALHYVLSVIQYFWLEGSLFLLFPLAVVGIGLAWRHRMTRLLPLIAWLVGLPAAYTVIQPLIQNRGRYLMPLIPVIVLLGCWAAVEVFRHSPLKRLERVVVVLTTLLILVFWVNGVRAYVLEVRVIESQHMAVAEWLRTHTPTDAAVATQDIGVLAYFADRRLVDMAGLTDPSVVPIMHDMAAMADYIRRHGGKYVVIFPSYYLQLIKEQGLRPDFISDKYSFHELGVDPLAVYQFP